MDALPPDLPPNSVARGNTGRDTLREAGKAAEILTERDRMIWGGRVLAVFETAPFDRSGIPPWASIMGSKLMFYKALGIVPFLPTGKVVVKHEQGTTYVPLSYLGYKPATWEGKEPGWDQRAHGVCSELRPERARGGGRQRGKCSAPPKQCTDERHLRCADRRAKRRSLCADRRRLASGSHSTRATRTTVSTPKAPAGKSGWVSLATPGFSRLRSGQRCPSPTMRNPKASTSR